MSSLKPKNDVTNQLYLLSGLTGQCFKSITCVEP